MNVLPLAFAVLISVLTSVPFSMCRAAPYPATGTSLLTDPSRGLFFHGFGFRLRTQGTPWRASVPSSDERDGLGGETLRFRNTAPQATPETALSIRLDELREKTSLESYARKWMKDYPNYGFEVLGTKSLNLGGGRALVVDLVQKKKNQQIRQVIFQNRDRIAVATCLDRRELFTQTLQTCNALLTSFEWTTTPDHDGTRPL